VSCGKCPARGETDRNRRIDVAAAYIAECTGENHDGQTVREGDSWYVSAAEHCPRARADKDQSEGADELGSQPFRQSVHYFSPFVQICSGDLQPPPIRARWQGRSVRKHVAHACAHASAALCSVPLQPM
jgi:hypothetical protein